MGFEEGIVPAPLVVDGSLMTSVCDEPMRTVSQLQFVNKALAGIYFERQLRHNDRYRTRRDSKAPLLIFLFALSEPIIYTPRDLSCVDLTARR